MGATTRARTGNSKPRIPTIDSLTTPSTTKRSSTTKANTSKPRTTTGTKVAGGRVSKGKTGSTTTTAKKDKATTAANVKTVKKPRTKTEKVVDAVVGIAEKVVGDLEGKPGKKAAGTAKVRGTDSTTKRKTAVKA